jgi:hypothetical protein
MSLVCSARGCQAEAVWSLLWNNPRLHPPDRRKSWLACEAHRASLGDFLGARGFLRDVVPVDRSPADATAELGLVSQKPQPEAPLG